jgi:hypothetical protein
MKCSLSCLLFIASGAMLLVGCSGDSTSPEVDTAAVDKKDADTVPVDEKKDAEIAPSKCISIADDLIADFTEDNSLHDADGRQGGFYVYGDDAGKFEPALVGKDAYPTDPDNGNPECSGKGSFHTKATGFAQWGAAMGTDFKPKEGSIKGTYDASKYKGVSFWAKAGAELKGVQVSFPDIYTDGAADPKAVDPNASACIYVGGATNNCSPYLVKLGLGNYADKKIDTEWRRFDVLFADTVQDEYNPGFHTEANKLDVAHLTAMAIQVNAIYVNGSPTPNDFELWIDDVNFIQ